MRRSRFSVEQIVAVLKQVELGMVVADACRKMGISEQTFYRWKKQYGSLEPDQARELKQLQEENTRLKKLVADLSVSAHDARVYPKHFPREFLDAARLNSPQLDQLLGLLGR